jgi:hypothetical protein
MPNLQWWLLLLVSLAIVLVWPPRDDRSLAVKLVSWAVDPRDELPVLPEQLSLGLSDDPLAVENHDRAVRQYDALYNEGGWTRRRLQLKVATEPFDPATERQVLTGIAVVTAFLALRLAARRR